MRIGAHVDSDRSARRGGRPQRRRGAVLPRRPAGLEGARSRAPDADGAARRRRRHLHPRAVRDQRGDHSTTGSASPAASCCWRTPTAAAAVGAKGLIVHGGHVNKGDDLATGFDNWRKTFAYAAEAGGFAAAGPDREHRRRRQRLRPPVRRAGPAVGRGRRVRRRVLPGHLPRPRRRGGPARHRRPGQGDHRPDRPGPRQRLPGRLRLRAGPARQPRPAARSTRSWWSRWSAPPARRWWWRRRAARTARPPTSPTCGSGSAGRGDEHWTSATTGGRQPADDGEPARPTGSRAGPPTSPTDDRRTDEPAPHGPSDATPGPGGPTPRPEPSGDPDAFASPTRSGTPRPAARAPRAAARAGAGPRVDPGRLRRAGARRGA